MTARTLALASVLAAGATFAAAYSSSCPGCPNRPQRRCRRRRQPTTSKRARSRARLFYRRRRRPAARRRSSGKWSSAKTPIEQARRILEAQIEPAPPPYASAIPPGTTLRRVFVTDRGEAYVDVSAEVRSEHPGGSLNEIVHGLHARQRADRQSAGRHRRADSDRRQGSRYARRTPRPAASAPAERSAGSRPVTMDLINDHAHRQQTADQLRPTRIRPATFCSTPKGRCSSKPARTRVICTASVEDRVPPFLRNTGKGWVTAEYGMLPRATSTRTTREASSGKVGGRTQEIQRLIGRSLRSVTRLDRLGERTVWIDCDVIQADGGTRTASITGAFVALVLALRRHARQGAHSDDPGRRLRRGHERRHRRRARRCSTWPTRRTRAPRWT